MTSREEIALQITLSAIPKLATPNVNDNYNDTKEYNAMFAESVVNFYNVIYSNAETYKNDKPLM